MLPATRINHFVLRFCPMTICNRICSRRSATPIVSSTKPTACYLIHKGGLASYFSKRTHISLWSWWGTKIDRAAITRLRFET